MGGCRHLLNSDEGRRGSGRALIPSLPALLLGNALLSLGFDSEPALSETILLCHLYSVLRLH